MSLNILDRSFIILNRSFIILHTMTSHLIYYITKMGPLLNYIKGWIIYYTI